MRSLNKKGLTLIAALMLIVFASTAVLGVSVFIVQRMSSFVQDEINTRCIYNAMAGISYALYQYRQSATLASGQTNIDANNYFVLVTTSGGGGGGGAASAIIIDARNSILTNSNRRVSNWTIRNNSAAAVTINQVTVVWQKTPKRLTSFVVNGITRWSGNIASPPAVFAVNITIPANTTYSNNQVIFNSSAAGDAGITLAFRMSDGTTTSPCTIYPAQSSTCVQSAGGLTIKSMGKVTGSGIYRSVQAAYDSTNSKITNYNETAQTVP